MESIHTKLALYGSKNECARTDNVFSPISEVCDGTVSLDKHEKREDIKDTWKEYNTEFSLLVSSLQKEFENGKSKPTEVASVFTDLLTGFLSSKPNILKEVKTFFKHKPTAMTNLNNAHKLKNVL